jgi:hypothetical protein
LSRCIRWSPKGSTTGYSYRIAHRRSVPHCPYKAECAEEFGG